jgi:hypothetical protein
MSRVLPVRGSTNDRIKEASIAAKRAGPGPHPAALRQHDRLDVQRVEPVFSPGRVKRAFKMKSSRMRSAIAIIGSVLGIFAFGGAHAHGDHKSEHGGTVGRGDDSVVVEFVVEKGTLSLYVEDESGEPFDSEKLTGTLTVVGPHRQQEVKLVSAGPHKLAAPGVAPVAGERLRARIQLPSGEVVESVALFSEPTAKGSGQSPSADASASSVPSNATANTLR